MCVTIFAMPKHKMPNVSIVFPKMCFLCRCRRNDALFASSERNIFQPKTQWQRSDPRIFAAYFIQSLQATGPASKRTQNGIEAGIMSNATQNDEDHNDNIRRLSSSNIHYRFPCLIEPSTSHATWSLATDSWSIRHSARHKLEKKIICRVSYSTNYNPRFTTRFRSVSWIALTAQQRGTRQ